jgi:hypothetical protein
LTDVGRLPAGPVNILLVFVPIGIIAGVTGWDPVAVFVINFLAIIPLAAVLSYATEEISVNLGEALGGLLNATFGNAVELIVRIRPPTFDLYNPWYPSPSAPSLGMIHVLTSVPAGEHHSSTPGTV